MRFRELLIEKTLEPASFYQKANLDAFINRLKTTKQFIDDKTHEPVKIEATPQEIKQLEIAASQFPPTGVLLKSKMPKLIPTTIGGVKINTIFREPDFGGKGGIKGKDTAGTDLTKIGNIGPAVEAWKAIGLFARLTNRTDAPIGIDDMLAIRDELAQQMQLQAKKDKVTGKALTKTETAVTKKLVSVPDSVGSANDTISVKINVALGSFQRAMAATPADKDLWGRIMGILKFVNENGALKRYNNVFSKNGRIDPVRIAVVGGEGEKTDIKTEYLGKEKDGTGKTLSSLSFSLKATSPKIGQSPGTTVEGIKAMYNTLGLDSTAAMEAIKQAVFAGKQRGSDESDTEISSRYRAIQSIFSMAGQQLEQKLSAMNNVGEVNFIEHFLGTLTHAMTGGANMILVDFNAKGAYKKLNPKTIKNLANTVDLEARVTKGTGAKAHPYLFVYDKNSNRNLMHVRLEVQTGGRLTLHYELDELINMAMEANQQQQSGNQKPEAQPATVVQKTVPKKQKPSSRPTANPVNAPTDIPDPIDDLRFSGE